MTAYAYYVKINRRRSNSLLSSSLELKLLAPVHTPDDYEELSLFLHFQKAFAMPALVVQVSIHFSPSYPLQEFKDSNKKQGGSMSRFIFSQLKDRCSPTLTKIGYFRREVFKVGALSGKSSFSGVCRSREGILLRRRRGVVLAKFNNGLNGLGSGGSGGGGGGGGGKIDSETSRVLGNLALAILLTYLSMTGQLGWLLDAIVSLWLLAVLVPIVGIGAFLWWAGRDILRGNCPNCGNEVQVFKSTLNEDLQLCPFCSQPFSVEGDEFVREPVKFSNQSTPFDQTNFYTRAKREDVSSGRVVDIEAEIRDAD